MSIMFFNLLVAHLSACFLFQKACVHVTPWANSLAAVHQVPGCAETNKGRKGWRICIW